MHLLGTIAMILVLSLMIAAVHLKLITKIYGYQKIRHPESQRQED